MGCGAIYSTHAQAIQRIEGAEIGAFYDIVPEKAVAASVRFGAPTTATLPELLEMVDVVIVCTPSGLHAEVGIAAANAGKHVLVEKPIEVSLPAACALVKACEGAGVKLSVISQHRFAPDIRRLKKAIESGELGPMIQGDAYIKWYRTQAYYDSGDWRGTWKLDGGGCLINQGVHYIDMVQWLMGGVRSVQARTRTSAHKIEVEDVAAALVEYKNGALGVIQGSTSFFPGFAERLELHGKYGSAMIEGDIAKVWEVNEAREEDTSLYGRGVQMQPTPNLQLSTPTTEGSEPIDAADRWIEQHKMQVEDFVRAIDEDREPFITGREGLEPLKMILAMYESSRQGGASIEVDAL